MKLALAEVIFVSFLIANSPTVTAQEANASVVPDAPAPTAFPTVVLSDLLNSVAKKSGKEFLVDNRVPAEVVIGQLDWRDVTYPVLHTVLRNNELAAVNVQGKVSVVPVDAVRQYALPVLYENDESRSDDEWVTRVLRPRNADAAMKVPVFRPLLPRQGHLSAIPDSNTLTIVARYANTERIAELVEDMDTHTP